MIGTDEHIVLVVEMNGSVERVFSLGCATLESQELSRLEDACIGTGRTFHLIPADEPFTVSDILHDLGVYTSIIPSHNGTNAPLNGSQP